MVIGVSSILTPSPTQVRPTRSPGSPISLHPVSQTPTRFALIAAFLLIILARGVVNRIGVSYGLRTGSSAAALAFWPFLAATVLLAPFAFAADRPRGTTWRLLAVKGAVSAGLCQALFVLSQQWGSATFASIASALVPVLAALLVSRTEPLSRRTALGGGLALTGAVVFALARSGTSGGSRPLLAVLAATAALLTAAWFYLHNRQGHSSPAPTLSLALSRVWPQLLASTLVLGLFGSFTGASHTTASLWWLHVLVGLIGYAAPLVVTVWLLPRTSVALATSTNYAAIPLTALASVMLLGAHFTLIGWIALAVVLTGLVVSLTSPKPRPLLDPFPQYLEHPSVSAQAPSPA